MNSLRTRAVAVGVIWAVLATLLGLWLLTSYLNGQSRARFIELLQTRHTQVLVAVKNNAAAPELIPLAIGDPVYQRPFSGHYWQVENRDGDLLVSPSLVDGLLPRAEAPFDGVVRRTITIADGEELLGFGQWLTTEDGRQWFVQSASGLAVLQAEISDQQRTLLGAFALVALLAIVSALGQVTAMLRPLNALRKDISARWESEQGLHVAGYPAEVAPLVRDINTLLDRNRDITRGSRKQAADLAHAIKTPAAIMRNELEGLQAHGHKVTDALQALDRLDAQLKRALSRMRADGGDGAVGVITSVDTALGRMERAFTALARNAEKSFSAKIAGGLRVRMDQSDLEEVVGNILDNAMKWSKSRFTLAASATDDPAVLITIADDGPGIPDYEIGEVVKSGRRLDQSKPGTGLGLAIAADLVGVYGGTLTLGRSEDLGGLVVYLRLPVPGGPKLSQPA
jgi:signal transduction histidine kinase